jgi:hypothetical protein
MRSVIPFCPGQASYDGVLASKSIGCSLNSHSPMLVGTIASMTPPTILSIGRVRRGGFSGGGVGGSGASATSASAIVTASLRRAGKSVSGLDDAPTSAAGTVQCALHVSGTSAGATSATASPRSDADRQPPEKCADSTSRSNSSHVSSAPARNALR